MEWAAAFDAELAWDCEQKADAVSCSHSVGTAAG